MSAKLWGGAVLVGALIALLVWLMQTPADSSVRRAREGAEIGEKSDGEPPREHRPLDRTLEERIAALEEDGEDDESDEADRVARVLTESGEPIADATVQFGERAFVTDAEGCAGFQWPEGERTLELDVRHASFVDVVEERADSGGDVIVRLRPGHTIRGWVRFPDGAPVREVRVRAWSDEGTNRPKCFTNERGEFVLTGIPDWSVTVEADSAKTENGDNQIIQWKSGDPPPEFTVRQSFILLRVRSAQRLPAVS